VLAEVDDPLVGTMLGKDYRVLAPIGIGGMAVVYLVEHQTLLKQFAAKVLSSALASSLEARARFTQEAHAASQLDHENIVSISDFGVTVDHRPFFVMELLRGQTLDQRLTEGGMSIEEVVAVSVPVARALSHAHAEGIVHLDVKPENIFLVQRSQGRWGVKVVDFGIAKTPLNPTITKLGETAGSPLFMAPEMCRGDDHIDQRADVYSFGILLYLMMCGRLPFVDDSPHRVLQMQLVQLPPPPREVNADLTPEVAAIVERALAKRPDDRYPSMDALMRDLEAALPPGSDRLLIEAASGTAKGGVPFAGALSGLDSMRMHQYTSAPMPIAPRRRRAPIVVAATALIAMLGGVLAWRELRAPRRPPAAQTRPAEVVAAAPPTQVELAIEPPPAQVAAVDPPKPRHADEPAAPPDPTPAEPAAAAAPAIPARAATRTPVAIPRRESLRVVKRTAGSNAPAIAAAASPSDPAPIAVAPAETPPAAPLAVEPEPAPVIAPPIAPPPAPIVLPPPAPPIQLAVARPSTGSLDATPAVISLDVKGSLSPSIVRRSVERTLGSLRSCYRTAARAGGATPALELRLAFEIDENSLATHVATSGGSFGSLASCAAGVAGQIRTQEAPDVGTAQVTVVIGFRPS